MTDWAGFVGFAGVVVTLMLALAWLSRDAVDADAMPAKNRKQARREFNRVMGGPAPGPGEPQPEQYYGEESENPDETETKAHPQAEAIPSDPDAEPTVLDGPSANETDGAADINRDDAGNLDASDAIGERDEVSVGSLSTGTLLANVVLTQGLFLGLMVIGIWWTDVPVRALGVAAPGTSIPAVGATSLGWSVEAVAIGAVLGVALYVFNQLGAALGDRIGIDSSTALREALAPASRASWAGLVGIVLPVVAVFEELLFRGVLIGGLAVASVELGVGLSPWVLVVLSAVAFALGHGAQGQGGIVVTGALGAVLGAAFVLSWSLPLVIVAHYVVNAVEFVVHEGFDMEWI